ncbi:hypothetical protein G6011_00291 [Alternaria panax]|uniref:Uncharacterized protein n=1 Tax=Alternaria panax TaxID=48097 RepID=A0AAD4NTG0_9PLEO|nr:hypothetical protein G6011_00291 [Alternaria panax]
MDTSTAGPHESFSSRAPRQAVREDTDTVPARKRLSSTSGAASSSKSRRRLRTTADLPTIEHDFGEPDLDSEGKNEKQSSNSTANTLAAVHAARQKGPFRPSWAHQLIHVSSGKQLPPDMFKRPYHPLRSYATPSQFDLSGLTIPLTAKEILTFFPNHVDIPEIQHRLFSSGIKGSFQAHFINLQYRLEGLTIVIPVDCRSHLKKAKTKLGGPFATKPTTFTTGHYTFVPGGANGFDDARTSYPLMDCGFFVLPSNFPMDIDSGPFTKALIQVQLAGNTRLMLSELDTFIATMGISRNLKDGYTDAGFQTRHRAIVKDYQSILSTKAGKNKIRFDW